jgi:hypothetical protein
MVQTQHHGHRAGLVPTLRGAESRGAAVEGTETYGSQVIADVVSYMLTRERRAAVNEMLNRAAEQP